MKKWIPMLICMAFLVTPASALEITAPVVPEAGREAMPENTESFLDGLLELLGTAIKKVQPDLREAALISASVISAVLLVSLLTSFHGSAKRTADFVGTAALTAILLGGANSMILLARETVQQLSDYGKLLLPVMTGAMAAQGGITASTGLYIGTAFFDTLLGSLLSGMYVPAVYLYLALTVAGNASGEDILKKLRDLLKSAVTWSLKTILTVFTTYMGITGVVSGTTDAAALKATKVTISSVVPVVGGILSDASEAVLVGAGVLKNAAGIYGILAVLALFLGPFLKIGIHYLLLKLTAAICGIFGTKAMTGLVEDVSSAMGMLLGITGSMCLLLLISTVCFLKGVG